jgi:hypothetical protein
MFRYWLQVAFYPDGWWKLLTPFQDKVVRRHAVLARETLATEIVLRTAFASLTCSLTTLLALQDIMFGDKSLSFTKASTATFFRVSKKLDTINLKRLF